MLCRDGARVYVLSVKDKFGDNGMVGAAILMTEEDAWRIDTFVMSCRVIGRQVEDALVNRLLKDATVNAVRTVRAEYMRSSKNGLVADFWRRMEFEPLEVNNEYSAWRVDTKRFGFRDFEYIRLEEENNGAGA